MSREKIPSWRNGRIAWQTRIYIKPETMDIIDQQAKAEGRNRSSYLSIVLDKIFAASIKGGDKT